MKTTVEIPDVLLWEVKLYAAERGLTFREVLEASLRRTVQSSREDKPFKLKKGSFRGSGLQREVGWEEVRDMIYEGRRS